MNDVTTQTSIPVGATVTEQDASISASGRDLVNQLLGQAQMANSFSLFSRTVAVSKLEIVKKNKLYQQLSNIRAPNGSVLRGTWEEFCNLLGMSVDKADEDIANLRAFGEAALDQMQRVGIGYRELRQFRRLPDDERVALIEVAKSEDKDSLVEFTETLITRSEAQRAELRRQVDNLASTLTQTEVKLDTVTAERDTAIAKLSRQPGDRDDHVPAVFADARAEIAVLQRKAAVSIESLHQSVRDLAEMGGGKDAAAWRDGTARMALAGLAELRMAVSAALADVLAMLPEEGVVVPATLSRLSDQEVVEVAAHWRSLTRVHDYEREIRATQRHNAATAGKRGRPREMPKAPAGSVGAAGTGSTGRRSR